MGKLFTHSFNNYFASFESSLPDETHQRTIREEPNRDWNGLGADRKYFRLVYEAHEHARARACAMLVKRCAMTAGCRCRRLRPFFHS